MKRGGESTFQMSLTYCPEKQAIIWPADCYTESLHLVLWKGCRRNEVPSNLEEFNASVICSPDCFNLSLVINAFGSILVALRIRKLTFWNCVRRLWPPETCFALFFDTVRFSHFKQHTYIHRDIQNQYDRRTDRQNSRHNDRQTERHLWEQPAQRGSTHWWKLIRKCRLVSLM